MDEIEMKVQQKVAACMSGVKEITDEYGISWCVVNGQRFRKSDLEAMIGDMARADIEREAQFERLKNVCSFL